MAHPHSDPADSDAELFRLLAENVKDYAVFVVDCDGLIKNWPSGAEQLFGYRPDEVIGKPADILFIPEDLQAGVPQLEMEQARSTGRGEDDRWHLRKDGSRFWSCGVMTPLWNNAGQLRGFAKIMRDQTPLRLRVEQEQFQATLLDAVGQAVIATTPDGTIFYWNRMAEELHGWTAAEAIGRHVLDIAVPASHVSHAKQIMQRVAAGESWSGEFVMQRQGRDAIPVDVTIKRVLDEQGAVKAFVSVAADISERRQAELFIAGQKRILEMIATGAELSDVLVAISRIVEEQDSDLLCSILLADERNHQFTFGVGPSLPDQYLQTIASAEIEPPFSFPCCMAMHERQVIVVADIEADDRWSDGWRELVLAHGLRSCRSTPVFSPSGTVLAAFATYRHQVHDPHTSNPKLHQIAAHLTSIAIEKKRNEDALRNSRETLHLALQAADLGQWELDLLNRTAERNLRHDQIFGYPALLPQWTYEMFLEHVVPEDRQMVDANMRQVLKGRGAWDVECRIRRADGQTRWIWAKGQTYQDLKGQARRLIGTVADITDRKLTETELHNARTRLDAALEAGAIATWIWDIPTNRVYTDTHLSQLFRLSSADAHGGLLTDFMQAIHPADLPKMTAALAHSVKSGQDYETDYRIIQPDESVRWFVARGRVKRDETDKPSQLSGVLVDITERKRLEEELRQQTEQLVEADRRKDEFLATLAHELRNPLAPIQNALQILKIPHVDAATAQQMRDMAERQVHHLVRLVDDLLDVSRVMRGKIELRKEPVELATVVNRAIETAQSFIDAQGHQLDVAFPPVSLLLNADPVRLVQVVANLLTNAAKYTPSNGHISVSAQREAEQAVLRVRDNGIGIAAKILPHIFDLFVQADQATTRSQSGLGIGLTLVKNLVAMHGGTVEATSEGLGRGAEFIVRLPLSAANERELSAGQRHDQPQEARRSSLRLLVVDDNRDAATSFAMLLRLMGHEVAVAHDGPAALEVAAANRPDLVFLDIGMPGMDGYEVAHRLRAMPELQHIVLAAVTGWGQQEDRQRAFEAGFDHHLVKPPEPEAVESLLAELKSARD